MGIDRCIQSTYICPTTGKTETTTYFDGRDYRYDGEYPVEVAGEDMKERGITSFVYSNDQDFSYEVEVFENGESIFNESGGERAEFFVELENWILEGRRIYRKVETLFTTAELPYDKKYTTADGRVLESLYSGNDNRRYCYARGGWRDDFAQTETMYVHHTLKLLTAIASEEVVACFKLFVEAGDWNTVYTLESDAVKAFISTQE